MALPLRRAFQEFLEKRVAPGFRRYVSASAALKVSGMSNMMLETDRKKRKLQQVIAIVNAYGDVIHWGYDRDELKVWAKRRREAKAEHARIFELELADARARWQNQQVSAQLQEQQHGSDACIDGSRG